METLTIIGFVFISYLIGSFPSSIWMGRAYQGIDVREHGSGNAGATNTFRVLGTRLGIFVLLLDIFKGVTAVSLAYYLKFVPLHSIWFINIQLLLGVMAVVGHIFPVYEHFKGGKGIATLLGMLIGINYMLALSCVLIFVVVLLVTRYVSLSSMLAVVSFPILTIFVFHRSEPWLVVFGLAATVLVIFTHRKNIVRLLNGTESRVNLFKKA